MGYTTDFSGRFHLNKKLDKETKDFLTKLANTRRMARNLGPEYGVEGEFFVDGKGFMGQETTPDVIDGNRPPSTQPGMWCQWIPTDDGKGLVWDGGEKFYDYVEWLEYIINKILAPKGYIVNGCVLFQGEDIDDRGYIVCENNKVRLSETKVDVSLETKPAKVKKEKPVGSLEPPTKRKISWR